MPEISLTDFVDFVVKVGSPKLTKVREIKTRGQYSPAIDFWKRLREGIICFHRDSTPLDVTLNGITDRNKLKRYPAATAAYERFARKRDSIWFDPPSSKWVRDSLEVRVNPEVGLRIDNAEYIIKLYFKGEALTKARLAVVFELMREALQPRSSSAVMAVVDVGNGKLIKAGAVTDLGPLLTGEAASFVTMWNAI